MYLIPSEFKEFISYDCDRSKFIQTYLKSYGIEAPLMPVDGKNHIYVKFPLSQYNPMFKIKTVIAHYDRVENSPGANDNSAAVFSLMNWAIQLKQLEGFHNIRLIFTDGEELGSDGVNQQGSFALAALFKKLGIINDDIFVFDCMGRGNVPVICETQISSVFSNAFVSKINALELKAEKIIKKAADGKWFKMVTNYSDNAGFLLHGIPACAITMLPSEEIGQDIFPKTWSMLHTPQDNLENLTPEAFEITQKILMGLTELKTLCD